MGLKISRESIFKAKRGNFVDSDIAYSLERNPQIIPPGIEASDPVLQNPVANLPWEYINFKRVDIFTPAANYFKEMEKKTGYGRYTNAIPGTAEYHSFWKEEKFRCLHGYEPVVDGKPCGIRITGEHYFYLNYCQIDKRVKLASGEEMKNLDFPSFMLMDYYWFLELERCENPHKYGEDTKYGMIMTKARRKGYSFKNAAGVVWKYTFFKKSYCIIGAYMDDYANATFTMALEMLSFLEEHTPFRHGRIIDKPANGIIMSGYIEEVNGRKIRKGYKSVIRTMTFKNSAFKSAGKSATRFIFEEAGLFENLETAYNISKYLFMDGNIMIGIPIIFGTGGDMSGKTQDFAKMFKDPAKYGLRAYRNIYDKDKVGYCGFFVDEMWYRPGKIVYDGKNYEGVDECGNPLRWAAEYDLDLERELTRKGDRKAYLDSLTQRCKTPREAFLIPDGNIFPTAELYERLATLETDALYKYISTPGELVFSNAWDNINGVSFMPDLDGKFNPIYHYPVKAEEDRNGCIVMYEAPIRDDDGTVPNDMYIIGHDPYAINTDQGESLGVAYVMLSNKYIHKGYNKIVASYIGRPTGGNSMGVYNTNLEKLSMYYGNAKIMFENTRGTVMEHFTKRRKLNLLMDEPGYVLTKVVGKKWKNTRIKGCTMEPPAMKGHGEQYIYDWLLESRGFDATGREILNLDVIPDVGLLKELISYNRDGNFDRVMAFMQLMIAFADTYNRYEAELEEAQKEKTSNFGFLRKQLLPRNVSLNTNK